MKVSPTLLIVEDNDDLRFLYKRFLNGFSIIEAENGAEGVQKYIQTNPKPLLVLMDIEMPILDGVAASIEIFKLDPDARIIALTAFSRVRKEEIVNAGVRTVLSKPINLKKLQEIVVEKINNS